MKKTVILDTNVLLADPNIVLAFPQADVIIPEVVLGELDKLKISRTDADVRFRGREVSRLLFELSENGSLLEGVELPDGGTLRVVPFHSDMTMPEGFSSRNTDDRILASAYSVFSSAGPDEEVVLITNDLNMLLKAQTLGMPFERAGDGTDDDWLKKYVTRPVQRYRIPLTILLIAGALFAGSIAYATKMASQGGGSGQSLPADYKSILTAAQSDAMDSLVALERNANDSEALLRLGNYFYLRYNELNHADPAGAITFARTGIRYYTRYLETSPNNVDARVDMAALLLYSGQTDMAIQEVSKALEIAPGHLQANYNLGIIYWQGRQDYDRAIAQFEKVMDLTRDDVNNAAVYQSAQGAIAQIKAEQAHVGSQDTTL